MLSVHAIATEIVDREGGYVNDPDDPGGATNHGVTIETMRRLGLDISGDGRIDAQDVQQLSRAQAIEVLKTHYFDGPKIGHLPDVLHASVFDMQVNAGGNAVKILQRLLGEFGQSLKADGGIGPKTIAACEQVFDMAPHHLVDAYGIARRNYYYAIADARPASRKYARRKDGGKGGWITRAEDFIAPAYHLTDTEHFERTETWG